MVKRRAAIMTAILTSVFLTAALLSGCSEKKEQAETAIERSEAEEKQPEEEKEQAETGGETEQQGIMADGVYAAEVTLSGGTGKATIDSPCKVTVENGQAIALIQWSSPHYDYMIVNGEKFEQVNEDGNSQFEIPVAPDADMEVQADTTAMSQPHLIDYTLRFTITEKQWDDADEEADGAAGSDEADGEENNEESVEVDSAALKKTQMKPPEIEGLTYRSEMEKQYAEEYSVFYYEEGYKVLMTSSGRQYLLIPEGSGVPEKIPEDMTVIQMPADHIYLAASSAMALFHALDALNVIAFSGTDADGWYIEDAAEAMRAGDIAFAGKYSQPDYEGLLAGECDLAIESTMILHTPEVLEKLEALGIPVLIDESSHESHPLGRTEWIRFYGALLDKEQEADAFFESQAAVIGEMEGTEDTGKTVAFFFINNAGSAVVRRTDDYIPEMIRLAGGNYAFQELQSANPESRSGSATLSMEEFYAQARDCDYLIYNASIDAPLKEKEDLLDKSSLFADFKAFQEDHVYTTDKYMYQATDIVGELIRDIHEMLTDGADSDMLFLKKVS